MNKNVLITGGTGFIGSWMLKAKPDSLNAWGMSRADYDMVRLESISGIDYVVHLAPVSPYDAIECARNNNARLLYCSSGAVYDQQTEYAKNKRRWEQECLDSGVDCVIARPFTFTRFNVHRTLFDAARKGEPLEIWGDGSTVRSFMHGAELGRLMWAVLLCGECGQAYDIGSSRPVTILRLARRIKALCKTDSEIRFVDKPVSMPVYLPTDTAKTKAIYNQWLEMQKERI